MAWDIFGSGKRKQIQQLIQESEQRSERFHSERLGLDVQKNELMKRQVDLWSVPTMSTETEEEYFTVSMEVAKLVKQIGAYDEYLFDLRNARSGCTEHGQCDELTRLLTIDNPWLEKVRLGKQDEMPRVVGSQ